MKAVVFGATGTIGSHVSRELDALGHEVVRAARSTGVDAYTGNGVREALTGAEVAFDCLNVETISAKRAVDYFTRTARTLSDEAAHAGVKRVICVSIAGADDPAVNRFFGYYKGKAAQERLYHSARIDCTTIHSAQWFELIEDVVRRASLGPVAVLPTMQIAPLAARRAAKFIVENATNTDPGDHSTAVRGPEQTTALEAARTILRTRGDIAGRRRRMMTELAYLGSGIAKGGLIPTDAAVDDLTLTGWLAEEAQS